MDRNINTKLLLGRFFGLMGPVPLDIEAVFRLASIPSYVQSLGTIMIITLLLEIGIQPFLSTLLDRYDRKRVQLFSQVCASFAMIAMGIYTQMRGAGQCWYLASVLLVDVYYFVSYQAYAAMAQDVVSARNAGTYSGIAELVSQFPVIMGGVLVAFLWSSVGFPGILMLAGLTILAATPVLILLPIPPVMSKIPEVRTERAAGYMRANFSPVLYIFLLNIPYVAVVSGNYLKPVFIARVLSGNPGTLGVSESIYAGMASLTGLIAPLAVKKAGEFRSAMIFSTIYAAGSLLMPLFPLAALFFIFQVSHGMGNPGNRISRNTLVLKNVPREQIGRFNGSVNILDMICRVALLSIYITFINGLGVRFLMEVTAVVVCIATLAAMALHKRDPMKGFHPSEGSALLPY